MNYRAAKGVELVERDGATFLMARTPLTLVRLNAALVALVERALAGTVTAGSEAEARVLEQLALKGFLVREAGAVQPQEELPLISIVIPVLDRAEELSRCLDSLNRVQYPREK